MSGQIRNEERILESLDRALAGAPGDESEIAAYAVSKNTTRFAGSAIHQNASDESALATARVVVDRRIGAATTNDLSSGGLRNLLIEAERLARLAPPQEGFRGLVKSSGTLAAPIPIDDETIRIEPRQKASRLRAAFDHARRDGAEIHGSFTTIGQVRAFANSNGIRLSESGSSSEIVSIAMIDGKSGYSSEVNRAVAKLPLEERVVESIGKARLAASSTPREITPGPHDVLLEPAALSEILEWLSLIGFSSRAFENGSSFLCGREGEAITGSTFTLDDDGPNIEGIPSRFDAEGVAKRRTPLIERGIARGAAFDKVTADRIGKEPTGHSLGPRSDEGAIPTNLFVATGDSSRDELLAGIERGIWITRFHYLNGFLDPKSALMTGMTRDGTFWIEDGRVTGPIVDMRFTESILAALGRLDGATRDRRPIGAWWGGGAAHTVPAIRIRGFTFTGVSKR